MLDERDGRLEQVGELRGLGVDEEIQSVRWFDDLAVVVTFRQMDPLYTIDLSDPTQPRRLGALKIPGFSAYLHPIGGDRLLGLGSDATSEGQNLGAQAAVFDIGDADPRAPGRQDDLRAGQLASRQPRTRTPSPGCRTTETAIAGLQDRDHSAMVLLHVAPDGSLTSRELPSVGGWGSRALPIEGGRVALVGNQVRIVSLGG